MIVAFFWLARRIFHIGRQAIALDRVFAGLVAQGVGIWMGGQAFINMGVNLGVLPTKGLTLPLMSYGGSAIVMNLVALAIVLRVDYREPAADAGRPRMSCTTLRRSSWPAGTGGHVYPGPRRGRPRCARAAGACRLARHRPAWKAGWCRRAASRSTPSTSAACAARACCTR